MYILRVLYLGICLFCSLRAPIPSYVHTSYCQFPLFLLLQDNFSHHCHLLTSNLLSSDLCFHLFFFFYPTQSAFSLLKCSVPCGRGEKSRLVFCGRKGGDALLSGQCPQAQKPSSSRACNNGRCQATWVTSEWSKVKWPLGGFGSPHKGIHRT